MNQQRCKVNLRTDGAYDATTWLRQFQEAEHLPKENKTVVKKLLDAFLTKNHLQYLAR